MTVSVRIPVWSDNPGNWVYVRIAEFGKASHCACERGYELGIRERWSPKDIILVHCIDFST